MGNTIKGTGFSAQLADTIALAVQLLERHYGAVEVRLNHDGQSGGVFLAEVPYSVGITAQLWRLSDVRNWLKLDLPQCRGATLESECQRLRIDPKGAEEQVTIRVHIAWDGLRDKSVATFGATAPQRWAYPHVASAEEGLAFIARYYVRSDQLAA